MRHALPHLGVGRQAGLGLAVPAGGDHVTLLRCEARTAPNAARDKEAKG